MLDLKNKPVSKFLSLLTHLRAASGIILTSSVVPSQTARRDLGRLALAMAYLVAFWAPAYAQAGLFDRWRSDNPPKSCEATLTKNRSASINDQIKAAHKIIEEDAAQNAAPKSIHSRDQTGDHPGNTDNTTVEALSQADEKALDRVIEGILADPAEGDKIVGSQNVLDTHLSRQEAFEAAYKIEQKDIESMVTRNFLWAFKGKITKSIEENCKVKTCTTADIARITSDSIMQAVDKIEASKTKLRRLRGTALVLGALVAVTLGVTEVKDHIPAELKVMSEAITIITVAVITSVVTPLWGPFKAQLDRNIWRLRDGKITPVLNDTHHRYSDISYNTKAKITEDELAGMARVQAATGVVTGAFTNALTLLEKKDATDEDRQKAADKIALMAMQMRTFYFDLNHEDPDIVIAVRMMFTQYVKSVDTRLDLYHRAMNSIMTFDTRTENQEVVHHYARTLKLWLDVKDLYQPQARP